MTTPSKKDTLLNKSVEEKTREALQELKRLKGLKGFKLKE